MDAVAEAKARWAARTWREDDLQALQIRFAALLLDIADHRRFHLDRATVSRADERLWAVLDREKF